MAVLPEASLSDDTTSTALVNDLLAQDESEPQNILLFDPIQLLAEEDYEVGIGNAVICSVAILFFSFELAFTLYNAIKFYRHRSYALGLFYILCILNFIIRMLFFVSNFFHNDSYWNVVFLCYPASFSCAIGVCQIMNYSVLYIRLDSYAKHRAKKGDQIESEDLEKTTNKEYITTGIFTTVILAFPFVISILLLFQRTTFDGDVIARWERYQLYYMLNIIVITILLVISTLLALRHMRKVFGQQSVSEEKAIWTLLLIFCGSYVVRVIMTLVMYFYKNKVANLFLNSHTYFLVSVFVLWLLWDALPLLSILYTHYRNF